MRSIKILFIITLPLLTILSCRKEDALHVDDIPGLGGDTWTAGPIDQWLYDSLTVPFNIATKYKWDQFELEVNKILVPPKEEKVVPVMSTIKRVWIDPYIAEAGELFFKVYSPKFFVLVGSVSFNLDGSVTLGTAEGGRKVVLYDLNNFKNRSMPDYTLADSSVLIQMFHVIEHEFTHILDQNIRRPVAFDEVGKGLYTADWINTNDAEALKDGFISAYALSSPTEDFAETLSLMIIEGKDAFDARVNSITETSKRGTSLDVSKARLRQKETLLVDYLRDAWHIDFYSLQSRTRQAMEKEIY